MSPGREPPDSLEARFEAHLAALGSPASGERVVVAVSGGVDSLVLLHLLRFTGPVSDLGLHVAHFDHRMRESSAADARWVCGLARAWGLPVTVGRAATVPLGEAAARDARYAFLDGVRRETGAAWLLTAHHADDQAETVLFRIFRGTGILGLAGIPERRSPGVLRPLLPFWKDLIVGYASRSRIRPRIDPSNRDLAFARNRLRHEVIPALERSVAPNLRRALVDLAERAREDERAWEDVLEGVLGALETTAEPRGFSVALSPLLRYDSAVRARVLRELARRLGGPLDKAGTRAALKFAGAGSSGRSLDLPGGLQLRRDFDRIVMTWSAPPGEDLPLDLPDAADGAGTFMAGGRRYRAEWSSEGVVDGQWVERFPADRLAFPLHLRAWRPGDLIRMPYGAKKLKKLMAEARIPALERRRQAVLADALGQVLWVPGLARSVLTPADDGRSLAIGIADAHLA